MIQDTKSRYFITICSKARLHYAIFPSTLSDVDGPTVVHKQNKSIIKIDVNITLCPYSQLFTLSETEIEYMGRVRAQCLLLLSGHRRSVSVYEAVWWKSGMLIQDQGCFAAHKYTAEGCLSAPPVITLNHSTQSQTFFDICFVVGTSSIL